MSDDRVTIGERYGRATESSNLRLSDRPGDVDMLIAAGWLEERLGALLFRLRLEYESTDPTIMVSCGVPGLDRHLSILLDLPSLHVTRQEMGLFAERQAKRKGFKRRTEEVHAVTGQALEVFLAPNCHRCEGRGFNGMSHRGDPMVLCRPCRGTGSRKGTIGKDEVQHEFARHLLSEMDRLLARSAGGIKYGMSGDEIVDVGVVEAARAELAAQRLAAVPWEVD